MVERASQPVNFDTGGTTAIQQAAGGVAPARTKGTEHTIYVEQGRMSNIGDLVGRSLTTVGSNLLDKSLNEAYLKGAAQLNSAKTVEELDTNWLTKDWTVAGYRDAAFKLEHAKAMTVLSTDMESLRQKDVPAFDKYMQDMRTSLMPQLEGMSIEGRKLAVQQMANTQEVAYNTYTRERFKYVTDVEAAAVNADIGSKVNLSQSARTNGSPEEYLNATNTVLTAITGTYNNTRLPLDVRQNLVAQAAEQAIKTGDAALWGAIQKLPYDAGDGSKGALLDRLPYKMQAELGELARRTAAQGVTDAALAAQENLAKIEAGYASGQAVDYNTLRNVATSYVRQGFISPDQFRGVLQRNITEAAKVNSDLALGTAFITGDRAAIEKSGKTGTHAADAAIVQFQRQGLTQPQIMEKMAGIGLTTGAPEAFAVVGEYASPAVSKLMTGQEIVKLTPDDQARITVLNQAILSSRTMNRPEWAIAVLSKVPQDQQEFLSTASSLVAEGSDPNVAYMQASAIRSENMKLSPSARAAKAGTVAEENMREIAKLEKESSAPSWFKSRSQENIDQSARFKALREEVDAVSLSNPSMNLKSRMEVAQARVVNRVFSTDFGDLILPRGSNVTELFGLPKMAPTEHINTAISQLVDKTRADKKSTVSLSIPTGNTIVVREANADGTYRVQGIPANELLGTFNKLVNTENAKNDAVHGKGSVVEEGGIKMYYNGKNSAGVLPDTMHKFRQNLIQNEGFRATPYDDATGKPLMPGQKPKGNATVGVGFAAPEYFGTGQLSQAEMEQTFAVASSNAAKAGIRVQQGVGVKTDNSLLLFSELAYHSGSAFAQKKEYAPFLSAVASKAAPEVLLREFSKTPAYAAASNDRRKHYNSLVQSIY